MEQVEVQKVKLGYVLFLLDNKIEIIEHLLQEDEQSELRYRNGSKRADGEFELMAEFLNGKVYARNHALEKMKEFRNTLTNLK
tara:strand:+ start:1318 stop:1566 length:249 start_codon:yes stop_codon:yes gene_type:complete